MLPQINTFIDLMPQQSMCTQCRVVEDIQHYMVECTKYRLARDYMKAQLRKYNDNDFNSKVLLGRGKYNR